MANRWKNMCPRGSLLRMQDTGACLQADESDPFKAEIDNAEAKGKPKEKKSLKKARRVRIQSTRGGAGL